MPADLGGAAKLIAAAGKSDYGRYLARVLKDAEAHGPANLAGKGCRAQGGRSSCGQRNLVVDSSHRPRERVRWSGHAHRTNRFPTSADPAQGRRTTRRPGG